MVDLNSELGRDEWIRRTGLPLTLSDTVTKVRWLRDVNPDAARRTAAVAVVRDWLTWRLRGFGAGEGPTRRVDHGSVEEPAARDTRSPTPVSIVSTSSSMRSAARASYRASFSRSTPPASTGQHIPGVPAGIPIGVGSGDNAAAALALGLTDGDTVLSLGTSGVVYTRSRTPVHDYAGYVCSYADATGDHYADSRDLERRAQFRSRCCASGVHPQRAVRPRTPGTAWRGRLDVCFPTSLGERTPDLPHARGSLLEASLSNFTRPNFARAVVEGTLVSQVAMLDALRACGVRTR